MKRKILFYALLVLPIVVFADTTIALDTFNYYRKLYEQEKYENAMQGFQICMDEFQNDPIFIENCRKYIRLCETQLNRIKQEKIDSINKEKAEAEQRQREREEKKLIYISTDAMTSEAAFTSMRSEIMGHLSDAGFKFTDDREKSYWSIYITAFAQATESEYEPVYYSTINGILLIINEIKDEIIYENVTPEIVGNGTTYNKSIKNAYQELDKKIGELIINKLNK